MSSRPKTHVHIDKLGESTMPERSFSSVDFIKGLEQFSHYKYSWTDEPFDYLFQFVGQKSPLYEQFSSLLIDDAVSKGVSRDQVNNNLMDYTSRNSISTPCRSFRAQCFHVGTARRSSCHPW